VVDKDKVELVATDEHSRYRLLDEIDPRMRHGVVHHSTGEYVRGNVDKNNIELFWSLVERGMIGTSHGISKKYLPLYLNEFRLPFNNRKNPDIFRSAVAGC
jgi:transposase-like protein